MALAIENIRPVDARQRTRPASKPMMARSETARMPRRSLVWPSLGLAGAGIAAAGWLVATFVTMHGVAGSYVSGGRPAFEASLGLNAIQRATTGERTVHVAKFSRLVKTPVVATATALPQRHLVAVASAAHKAMAAVAVKPVAAPASVDIASAEIVPIREHAMLEPDRLQTASLPKPFSLVLSNDETTDRLPDLGPLPLSRPGVTIEEDAPAAATARGRKPAGTQLAYAKPDAPIALEDDEPSMAPRKPMFGGRKGIAYYDISAGVVHMPNGERLEAHSGIGAMRDNPDFVHVPMKGPTPPGTYKVTMRESLFHGVEAVRLTPTDGVAPHGRVGLLAHSYLLRSRRGDSHGCVAFADYPRFLKAFKRGEVTQMVIVKSMRGGFAAPKKTLASLFSRDG